MFPFEKISLRFVRKPRVTLVALWAITILIQNCEHKKHSGQQVERINVVYGNKYIGNNKFFFIGIPWKFDRRKLQQDEILKKLAGL
jgi:hypothetical protein